MNLSCCFLNQGSLNLAFKAYLTQPTITTRLVSTVHTAWQPRCRSARLISRFAYPGEPRRLLRIAGTYGYKEEKYEIAMKVGDALFDFVRSE